MIVDDDRRAAGERHADPNLGIHLHGGSARHVRIHAARASGVIVRRSPPVAKAMQERAQGIAKARAQSIAKMAYLYADAMLEARLLK